MADKTTHFGRAGEYFAMSELLLRGWNVAVPVVDVGDDVLVIDDNDKTTWRLQVKTAQGVPKGDEGVVAAFKLSRAQLRSPQNIELFYMLIVRHDERWRFLILPRAKLQRIRAAYVEASQNRSGRGRRPAADEDAATDGLTLYVELKGLEATGWEASLVDYLDRWPEELPPVTGGPGSIASRSEQATSAAPQSGADVEVTPPGDLARSPDREK